MNYEWPSCWSGAFTYVNLLSFFGCWNGGRGFRNALCRSYYHLHCIGAENNALNRNLHRSFWQTYSIFPEYPTLFAVLKLLCCGTAPVISDIPSCFQSSCVYCSGQRHLLGEYEQALASKDAFCAAPTVDLEPSERLSAMRYVINFHWYV